MPSIIGVIPARYASSRFPGKPLADILGKPMIEWVYRRTKECSLLQEVIVATDDERIQKLVEGFGGKAIMTSQSHKTGTERLAEVAQKLPADYYLNIQGDEPLVRSDLLELLIGPLLRKGALMSTLATAIEETELTDPNRVKVVVDFADQALYFSRAPIPFSRGQYVSNPLLHMGFYGLQRDFLLAYPHLPRGPLEASEDLEQLRALENGYRISVVKSNYRTVGVDCLADLDLVKKRLKGEEAI